MRPALHRARRAVLACARQGRDALLGGRSPAASVAARALVAVFAFSLSAGHVGAQARPVSSPIELSGKRLIARGGRLYFGTDDRAFSYDPGASSLSGRGLTTRIAPVSTDWLTFLRTEGDAVLPIYGGTRDGQACFSGLRRYAPAGDELLFATKECLLAAELPAVLLGAHDFHVLSGRLFYKRDNKLYVSDGTAGGSRQIDDLGTVHSPLTRVDSRLVYTSNDIFSSFRDIAS